MSEARPGPPSARTRALVAAVLVVYAAALVHTALRNAETYDEPFYLLAGRSYWASGDVSLNREHPPLLKWLIGLPLALADTRLPAHVHTDSATQLRHFAELNADPDAILLLGRLPLIGVGLLAAWLVFRVGRRFGGDRAGLLALLAYVLQPALTGNTPLAALDLGAAAFAFGALALLGPLRTRGGPGPTLAAGVGLGLALATKFSNLALLPVFGVLLLYDALRARTWAPLARGLGVALVAFSCLVVLYGVELRPRAALGEHPRFAAADGAVLGHPALAAVLDVFGDGLVPLPSLLEGVDAILGSSVEQGHPGFFRGEHGAGRSWPSYYLVTLAVKTPVGLLLLVLIALALWPRLPRGRHEEGPLLLFPLLVLLVFSTSKAQLGVRYVLPVCVALAVLVGRLAALDVARHRRLVTGVVGVVLLAAPPLLLLAFPERGGMDAAAWTAWLAPAAAGVAWLVAARRGADLARAWRGLLALGVAAAALEVGAQHPEHLVFSNAFAGGPERGWRIQCVGDDWGQGTPSLARAQAERGWPRLNYEPYSTGAPERFGLDFRAWAGAPLLTPGSRLVAVHAAIYTREPERMGLLEGLEPMAVVNGILVFDVPAERLVGAR